MQHKTGWIAELCENYVCYISISLHRREFPAF